MSAVATDNDFNLGNVEIVPMRRRHVRQVMRIEGLVYPRPWSAALFMQEIARRPDRVYLILRYQGDVIGYAGLMTSGLESHITTIAVDPAFQRQGLGMMLMLALMDASVEKGGVSMSLEVRKTNHGAQSLYTLFGFQPVGIRKGYYIETNEDAIVMLVTEIESPAYRETLDTFRNQLRARADRV